MELQYNPKHTGDKVQILKSFLIGSLFMSSFVYFVATEDVVVFFASLGLMLISFVLFLDTIVSRGQQVYLGQNIIYIIVGVVVSLIANFMGYLLLYLVIIFILILVTWLHKYKTHAKKIKNIKKIKDIRKKKPS